MSTSPPKTTEAIWYKEPANFFLNVENAVKFIPDSKMSLNEQLNAAFRFALYFSIVVTIVRQDVRVMFFAVFVAIFTYLVAYTEEQKNSVKEGMMQQMNIKYDRQKRACMMPTKNNPFMNVLVSDYSKFPNRPPACNIANKGVKQALKQFVSNDVYQDIEDVFGRNTTDRQFFTNPITTIPNSQGEFAHWLYNNGSTCKEKSIACQARL